MRALEVELPGARAVFTTRDWGDMRVSHAYAAARLGVPLVFGRQVHGNVARVASAPTEAAEPPIEADAIVTDTRGLAPMVLVADCVPIVIAGEGAVATVHAGWRGLASDVIAAAVQQLRSIAGQSAELGAAIGPAAGVCCYEVGDEVHSHFDSRGEDLRDGRNLDLKAIAAQQLAIAGVSSVHDVSRCTICDSDGLFFSYRREGEAAGRQAGIAWLT